jgi:hypothetical protein
MNILWDIVSIQLLSGQALAEPFQLPFAKHSGSARRFHDVPRSGVSPSANTVLSLIFVSLAYFGPQHVQELRDLARGKRLGSCRWATAPSRRA